MNKYLKKFNEISENVGGYTELTRCLIADEFDCYYGGYYEDEEKYSQIMDNISWNATSY